MKKLVIAAVTAALVPATAFAAPATGSSSTDTGTATAVIVTPITLTHDTTKTLDFGKFTVGAAGNVTISADGATTTTGGGVAMIPGSTGAADGFDVSGDKSRNFSITTTKGTVTGQTNSISIPFTTTPSAASGTLDASTGTASFTVGGKLKLAGTETADTYTGSYSATVAYN